MWFFFLSQMLHQVWYTRENNLADVFTQKTGFFLLLPEICSLSRKGLEMFSIFEGTRTSILYKDLTHFT